MRKRVEKKGRHEALVAKGLTLALWDGCPGTPGAQLLDEFPVRSSAAEFGSTEHNFLIARPVAGVKWYEIRRDDVPLYADPIRTTGGAGDTVRFPLLELS